jgi:hypothetical protein
MRKATQDQIQQRRRRIPVYDSNGTRIGWTSADQANDGHLDVEAGMLFPVRLEIPRDWIAIEDEDYIRLARTRRDVHREQPAIERGGNSARRG